MKVVWTHGVIISLFLWPQDSWFGWKVEQPLLPKEALGSGALYRPLVAVSVSVMSSTW